MSIKCQQISHEKEWLLDLGDYKQSRCLIESLHHLIWIHCGLMESFCWNPLMLWEGKRGGRMDDEDDVLPRICDTAGMNTEIITKDLLFLLVNMDQSIQWAKVLSGQLHGNPWKKACDRHHHPAIENRIQYEQKEEVRPWKWRSGWGHCFSNYAHKQYHLDYSTWWINMSWLRRALWILWCATLMCDKIAVHHSNHKKFDRNKRGILYTIFLMQNSTRSLMPSSGSSSDVCLTKQFFSMWNISSLEMYPSLFRSYTSKQTGTTRFKQLILQKLQDSRVWDTICLMIQRMIQ